MGLGGCSSDGPGRLYPRLTAAAALRQENGGDTPARSRAASADDLPGAALGFDPRHLVGATVTTPTETRPNAPVKRLLELTRDADRVRAFSHAFNEQSLDLAAELATEGAVDFAGVFSRAAIEAVASDSALRARLATLLAADGAAVRICDDDIPVAGTILDDVVHLLVRDDTGVLRASIDTDDPVVHDWATDAFESYWAAASPLDRADLP